MHVGHLRSTIIGDCLCRIFEYLNMEVLRINHVGDWGTQFGMLITYLLQEYPDIIHDTTTEENAEGKSETAGNSAVSDISNLTKIYKESKKRFDENIEFKELSRLNVVKLQAGDPICRKIWQKLCDISRKEFQHVYNLLQVKLTEMGESFYNPMIPDVINELKAKGFVTDEAGMCYNNNNNFKK
jgi:arginyl-tRNA synthetase